MKLTKNETAVLKLLIESSAGNGHDFGFTHDARSAVPLASQLAGVVASLVKKGFIVVDPSGDCATQFQFRDGMLEKANALVTVPGKESR